LTEQMPVLAFWQLAREHFGDPVLAYSDAADERIEDVEVVFGAKNANLDLSLAISSQAWAHMHEAYLSWFVQYTPRSPTSIIDVGCDNGFLTCAYARFHPEAKVVGIDLCPESVACAKQLAARLDIPNVEFFCTDALNLPDHLADRTFDLVTSTGVADHVGKGIKKSVRSVEEALAQPVESRLAAFAQSLSGLLSEDSTLVSFETIPDAVQSAFWYRALHDAGVSINWDESVVRTFSMWEETNVVSGPLFVGSKGTSELVKPVSGGHARTQSRSQTKF
jgi:SAM-dependent methyltransferase